MLGDTGLDTAADEAPKFSRNEGVLNGSVRGGELPRPNEVQIRMVDPSVVMTEWEVLHTEPEGQQARQSHELPTVLSEANGAPTTAEDTERCLQPWRASTWSPLLLYLSPANNPTSAFDDCVERFFVCVWLHV